MDDECSAEHGTKAWMGSFNCCAAVIADNVPALSFPVAFECSHSNSVSKRFDYFTCSIFLRGPVYVLSLFRVVHDDDSSQSQNSWHGTEQRPRRLHE